jgi:hypothetical protein
VHVPSATDQFPSGYDNVLPIQLSLGAHSCLQQSYCHSYWEFNEYTNWWHPPYELPFTGGIPGIFPRKQYALQLLIPGHGPAGQPNNSKRAYGDNPNDPHDPDRLQESSPNDVDRSQPPNEEHAEMRLRFIPSGLVDEILLDAWTRPASFEPSVTNLNQRLFDAYAAELAHIDENHDGIVQVEEAEPEEESEMDYQTNGSLSQ